MNELYARAALRELGIENPTADLIKNWLRAEEAAQGASQAGSAPVEPSKYARAFGVSEPVIASESPEQTASPRSSKSVLEPRLRESDAHVRPAGRKNAGRPRIIASWFPAVAQTMQDGTSLRTALAINRLSLSKTEMRALYRNRTFRALYQEGRRRFLIESYGRKPTLRARMGQYV